MYTFKIHWLSIYKSKEDKNNFSRFTFIVNIQVMLIYIELS